MKLLLGIDQSTSATKAILFEESGSIFDKIAISHEQIYPRPGWVEHDPNEIWRNLLQAIQELCQRNATVVENIVGLSIANQRETFVVFDRQTGEPLHHAIVWQCRRGDEICSELKAAGNEPMIREKTGLKLDTYFPASKITWLMGERPDLATKLSDGKAVVSTIDAYLVHRLTAGKAFATDPTNASRTLLYDVNRLCWDEQLCELFGVPMNALPTVQDNCALFGETDAGGALADPVPICGVMGDSQASMFAQRCFEPGSGKATFGTGTSVMVNAGPEPKTTLAGAVLALAWVIQGEPTYALEGIINYSSATIAWLKDQLELIEDVHDCEAIANQVEDNGGVYFVPAFAGLSAPHWNTNARAAIMGMSGHSRKAHIVRAALESIGYQIRDVLDMISQEAGVTPQLMCADGGPTCNEFLMQFTADITQLEWEVSEIAESSAWGAAMAGLLGLGIHDSVKELTAIPHNNRRYSPRMPTEQAKALHYKWLAAVRSVLASN